MADAHSPAAFVVPAVTLLAAAVVAVPLFRKARLGSILGYLAAGLVIGPFGLRLISDPSAILHIAELGVVMFLFIVGLEMRPARLWSLRKQIFGLGLLQVGVCAGLLTLVGMAGGFPPAVSFVAGAGFVLTSTAIVMQTLEERGEINTPPGQKMVSILLLEDLAIVPLLALVAFLAPAVTGVADGNLASRLTAVAIGIGSIAALIVAGRYLLNPLFRFLAAQGAREVMTAAALLVVLGAALALQSGGLSMALGAFLAGVLLSESTFRHQLEADVEPFRGILLGLFFMAVGMSLDLSVVAAEWRLVATYVVAYMVAKAIGIYAVARLTRSNHGEAIERTVMMAQGGEFAFVLYAAATSAGLIDGRANATLTAIVIISMVLTPLALMGLKFLMPKDESPSLDGIDVADGLTGEVLMIGFGRFGQVVSQCLLAEKAEVSIIDNDVEMIQAAATFGFRIYYGDGTRLDVLHAAGAGKARLICVCVDKREAADKIVELVKAEFPLAKLFVRSFDRGHTIHLRNEGVDYEMREVFESALVFGQEALASLGVDEDAAAEIAADLRKRDAARLEMQIHEGIQAGMHLMHQQKPTPTPLTEPKRKAKPLNPEAEDVLSDETRFSG
ncbi:monovalent cation:proton antiporter-2 (CPA2) family protein [Phreatobacter oligotrophus]|uniref:monovalent cation:proton antiporter-2 (CPA2) family protein n=1 Tax=Phreatobacter oligotrophus TaxID=1122261 RepID=UPI0023566338|nr:monovalent cation:proton antiporter-2 (CPA2) family protein [Phreatobacter oligotrophus]MBX9991683.1 monovalent cation:proton antiporter-2 (CPA2) family protein [Phreatobacter oligotrophus]